MKSRIATSFLILSLISIISCNKNDQAIETIKVGIIPISEVAPIYVGIEKGYFKEENIDIDLTRMAGGALILPSVASGDLDIGFSNIVSMLSYPKENADLVILIGGTYETDKNVNHSLIVKNDSPETIQDYINPRIAVNTRNNIEELMLRRYLDYKGIDQSNIDIKPIPFPVMEQSLQKNEVDIVSIVEPFITKMMDSGFKKIANQYQLESPFSDSILVASYITRREWIESNQSKVDKFNKAFRKSTEFLNDPINNSEVRSIISKYTSLDQDLAFKIGLPLMIECVDIDALKDIISLAQTYNFIESGSEIETYIHNNSTLICEN